jgi:hypothetical protein
LRVAQYFVCFVDLFENRLCLRRRVFIRVIRQRQFAIHALDLRISRVDVQPQCEIVILQNSTFHTKVKNKPLGSARTEGFNIINLRLVFHNKRQHGSFCFVHHIFSNTSSQYMSKSRSTMRGHRYHIRINAIGKIKDAFFLV